MSYIDYQLWSRVEIAMVPTIKRGWQVFANIKYWKSFRKLFHITKGLTIYLSGYNPMIERTYPSR